MPELAINAIRAPRLPRTEMNVTHPYFLRQTADITDRSNEIHTHLRSKYNTREIGVGGTTGFNTTADEIEEMDMEQSGYNKIPDLLAKPKSATNTNYHSKSGNIRGAHSLTVNQGNYRSLGGKRFAC